MARKTKREILKNNLLKALEKHLGIISTACKEVGCSRRTFYDLLEEDEEFKENYEELSEVSLDFVESKLHELIRQENPTAIIFYLKTKGKKRGYTEKQHFEVKTDSPNPLTGQGLIYYTRPDYDRVSDVIDEDNNTQEIAESN